MTISRKDQLERKYEEMKDLTVQIQEIRKEFISTLDDLEDMIAEVY